MTAFWGRDIFEYISSYNGLRAKSIFKLNLIIAITNQSPNNTASMDIDAIFSKPFHTTAIEYNKELRTKKWELRGIIKFPLTRFIIEGDQFFKSVWSMIDNAKDYFWITTYAMDSSPAADTTLYKLIDAAARGVHVVLFIDNVQLWVKSELVEQFRQAGGKYMILNPQWRYESLIKYVTKDVWRRHHEKLIICDNKTIIGSSNIEGNYAGIRYGNSMFRDINIYCENIILDQFRQHFVSTANQYNFDMGTGKQQKIEAQVKANNQKLLDQFNKKYENSQFYPIGKYKLLHSDQKNKIREIERDVLGKIKSAKSQIKIIQSYHYTMSKFERQMEKAISKHKLRPQIITSGKRDQPVFQQMKNQILFQRLLKKGIKLYETRERLLHSKVYMFDKRWVSLGSMNNDRWSWLINNECNLLIDDERIYEQVNEYYLNLKQVCREVKKGYKITADQAASINFWQWFLYLSEIVMSQYGPPEEDYLV